MLSYNCMTTLILLVKDGMKGWVGIAILGKEAYLMHCTRENPQIREVYEVSGDDDDDGDDDMEIDGGQQNDYWMSLFDPRVIQVLDEMHTLSMHSDN